VYCFREKLANYKAVIKKKGFFSVKERKITSKHEFKTQKSADELRFLLLRIF